VSEVYKASVKAAKGLDVETTRWHTRAGDSSFWGVGIPHASAASTLPDGQYDPFVNFSGGGWWWHTAWATLDRGDVDILAKDASLNLHYIFMMINCRVLPMNFSDYAEEIVRILEDLQKKADKVRGYFNLFSVIDKAKEFKDLAVSLEQAVKRSLDKGVSDGVVADLNHCLMWVSRRINPIAHSDVGITDQMDMATFGAKPFPRIQEILKLADMPLHQAPEFKFLLTKLVRERNYVMDGFHLANQLIRETLAKHEKALA